MEPEVQPCLLVRGCTAGLVETLEPCIQERYHHREIPQGGILPGPMEVQEVF